MLRAILRIRLSNLAIFFVIVFIGIIFFLPQQTLSPGQLALFSVNSFLFGYYFNPLLNAQKTRVASLNEATRKEAMTLLDILTQSHLVTEKHRHTLKVKLRVYLQSLLSGDSVQADNIYYDELLRWSKLVKGEDAAVMDTIYKRLADTQANRDRMANLFASKVYSHEWQVVTVLFFITLYFAMQTHFGTSLFFGLMLAILCTGLCMLMAIMVKFATLTHKEAQRMWDPLEELDAEHFEDISETETAAERRRIEKTA